jgi:hypothetical protein
MYANSTFITVPGKNNKSINNINNHIYNTLNPNNDIFLCTIILQMHILSEIFSYFFLPTVLHTAVWRHWSDGGCSHECPKQQNDSAVVRHLTNSPYRDRKIQRKMQNTQQFFVGVTCLRMKGLH